MLNKFLVAAWSLSSSIALGATVAVIDSGVDVDHPDLKASTWSNPIDHAFDLVDDEGNGKTDDVYGWNFLENNNVLIDLTQTALLTPDIKTFFLLQGKVLTGTASDQEKKWLKKKLADNDFRNRLTQYGAFAHGTHVAGIVAGQSPENKVLTVRLIPTKNPLAGLLGRVGKAAQEGKDPNWIVKNIIKAGLFGIAQLQGQIFNPIGAYMAEKNVDVANGSFGVSVTQARNIVYPILRLAEWNKEPREELVVEFATFFVNQVKNAQKSLVSQSPETLFVFAAGNDGTNNDELPVTPAGIQAENVISVAATTGTGDLAVFSNYGETVDIAAIGVAVESTSPHGPKISMSGTSQAAPLVAGVAGAIKDTNPGLSASDIKTILMGTADKKPSLQGKVASGFLNTKRALYAANASKTQTIDAAINNAKIAVHDGFFPLHAAHNTLEGFIDLMPNFINE